MEDKKPVPAGVVPFLEQMREQSKVEPTLGTGANPIQLPKHIADQLFGSKA